MKVETTFLESPDQVKGFHWDVLRPLSNEEFTALKHGIAEDGIVSSIVLDKDGNILDGGHRLKAWKELLEEGHNIPRAPLQIRHDIGSEDGNTARLLARKLNMQRRQLTTVEKREVVKDQLRETWERSDSWIGQDLGVDNETVGARRRDLIDTGEFRRSPEEVLGRNGVSKPYPPHPKPKPAKKSKAPGTVSDGAADAKEAQENGTAPEDAPDWPVHPSQQQESEESKRVSSISKWMSGLSEFDPLQAADLVSANADIDARLVIAEEVIEWFEKYRDALKDKREKPSLRAIR